MPVPSNNTSELHALQAEMTRVMSKERGEEKEIKLTGGIKRRQTERKKERTKKVK